MYFVPFAQRHSNRCWYYIFGFCHGVSLMAPAPVGMPPLLPSLVRGYRLGPNLALYCWLCRLCRDVWKRCGFYSAVAQWPWFLVPSAMRLVLACFQDAFFFFSDWAAFGLPLAPLTLLLPASPLAIYSLCPLHNRIRTGFATAFRHAATASVGAASICALCSFLWYWFGDLAFSYRLRALP